MSKIILTISELAKRANAARNKKMTKEERSASARKAALARWAKRK